MTQTLLKVGDRSKYKEVVAWNKNEKRHKKYTMKCLSCGYQTQTSIKSFYNTCKKCSSHRIGVNKNTLEKTMWMRYKNKASKAGQPFSVSPDIFATLLHKDCYYCGAPPKQIVKIGRRTDNTLIYNGIDRKENSLGYTNKNCVPCCWTCNQAKSSTPLEEWKRLVRLWNERVDNW